MTDKLINLLGKDNPAVLTAESRSEIARAAGTGSTAEERTERARAAGFASGVARRKKRLMRETLASMMTSPVPVEDIAVALSAAGFPNSYECAIAFAALNKAASGDIEAARFVRDTLGEKPSEQMQLDVTSKPIQSLDLTKLSDAELEALADGLTDDE